QRADRAAGGVGAWDAAVLTRELRRLAPGSVEAALWPPADLAPRFASWLFTRAAPSDPRGVVTVEVLNASGEAGLALRATKVLRLAGFDVVHFGNADVPDARTAAVDRVGRPEAARAALAALGCRKADTLTSFEASPLTMVSVTVGRDAAGCAALGRAGTED
ncbi:MAG: LytR C-terminal domain-containing protein, partial [Elusimicrobia bacterium]|nr:LytR C-terminal domain-containing protein [Elusimicrobiota bacterium]